MIDVREVDESELRRRVREIWRVYDAIFHDAPDFDAWRDTMLLRHAARDRFRFVGAFDGDALVGMAWGYVGAPGQYYTDSVRRALGDEVADRWQPAFELVELGVLESYRGRGTGGAVYARIMQGVTLPAMLSTWDDDADPAVRLYRRAGWVRLGVHPSADGSRQMQIMGLSP
ncbi:MAG TPA: GNAT family N-acetyltransferase [Microbacterium sp.]|nr:GNAT family N-acetyltransferase [Microbacterium sp.]